MYRLFYMEGKNMNTVVRKMPANKVTAYAIAYLEVKIKEHEAFIASFEGDASDLVQTTLVERYKNEVEFLQAVLDDDTE